MNQLLRTEADAMVEAINEGLDSNNLGLPYSTLTQLVPLQAIWVAANVASRLNDASELAKALLPDQWQTFEASAIHSRTDAQNARWQMLFRSFKNAGRVKAAVVISVTEFLFEGFAQQVAEKCEQAYEEADK